MTPEGREILIAMAKGLAVNPLDPRELILLDEKGGLLGGVTLKYLDWDPPRVHLEEVRAFVPGGGRAIMEFIVRRADELQVPMDLFVRPLQAAEGVRRLNKRELKKWYRQFGFEPVKRGSDDFFRLPELSD